MAKDLITDRTYKEHGLDDYFSHGENQNSENHGLREQNAAKGNGDALVSYLRNLARYPLLSCEEEKALAGEIQACRERLLDLGLKFPSTFRESEELKRNIRAARGHGSKRSGELVERLLWRLSAINELSEDREAKTLLDQIKQVKAQAQEAIGEMVRANQRLVVSIAKHHMNRGMPLLDLIQEGNLGLMKAVVRFDPSRGNRFVTYAWWWIWQAMDKAVKDKVRVIRIPLGVQESMSKYRRTIASLSEEGKAPHPTQIMEKAGVSPRHFNSLRKLAKQPVSLEMPVGDGERTLGELVPSHETKSPAEVVALRELSEKLRHALKVLTPREEKVIRQRFGIGHERHYTLEEIGELLSITKEGVRQIEKRALKKLKTTRRRSHLNELGPMEE